MDIKPVKLVSQVQQTQIPDAKIDQNRPSTPVKPPEGDWDFSEKKIIINGQDVGKLLEDHPDKPTNFWSQLAVDLEAFRQHHLRKQLSKKRKKKISKDTALDEIDPTGELGVFNSLIEAYISKIMRLLKRKYDEAQDGITYTLDGDGQLTLNGMNVTSFLEMAKTYPNHKALIFLKGLKNRLSLILSNKRGNANYEKIRDTTMKLFKQIDVELDRIVEASRIIDKS